MAEAQQQCAETRSGLLDLPTELIHSILLQLPPLCIEHFSQTCKLARQHVYGHDRIGDAHLWKQLYLQRFDDFPGLWAASSDPVLKDALERNEAQNEDKARSSSSPASQLSSSVATTSTHSTVSSVMSLVQLRDRAARLYGGDPSDHAPLSLNFNAVITALLSVIDTSVPEEYPDPCRNTTWLSDSILSSGQSTWSQWVFPRSIMHSLDEFKIEAVSRSDRRSKSPQERKRRRLSSVDANAQEQNEAGPFTSVVTSSPTSLRRRSSSKSKTHPPDSVRRRSARLLKLIYPEALHPLVDQGIDIDALAQPQMRLAARIHCLYGVRAWKDAQKQRLTESPQEIPGQRQQDGLANEGAAQALEQTANQVSNPGNETLPPPIVAADVAAGATAEPEPDRADVNDDHGAEDDDDDNDDGDDGDDDDESFDEPPAAILRDRPRMFGPSFGFCSAPDEEDEVRARMRHRVYDSGYYGWSNGYAPLHAWRRPSDPRARDAGEHADEDAGDDGGDDNDNDDDIAMSDADRGGASQDGDDDAMREAAEFSDDDDIPDDPVPIEIEVSTNGGTGRIFQIADRYGNLVPPSSQDADPAATAGWNTSDDMLIADDTQRSTGRTPFQPPELGTYDAETRTYTYQGDSSVNVTTGPDSIQVVIDDTVDFVATDVLNVRVGTPGELIDDMRVYSGRHSGRSGAWRGHNNHLSDHEYGIRVFDPVPEEPDDDEDQEDDDDFDHDAEDWDDDEDVEDDDDDQWGPFGVFRPMAAAVGYRGCRADDEVKHLVEQQKVDGKDAEVKEQHISLRKKAVHWELVEAIMVVMYANLKEAIWLENWGVGIKIPKVYDESGVLVRDPMEKREFLEFPTGWISSLPSPLPEKLYIDGPAADPPASPPRANQSGRSPQDDEKPHDWARCESFWGGSYSFLDFSHFVDFNVRLARHRRQKMANARATTGGANGKAAAHSSYEEVPKPNLVGQEEAVGDCLQLRLELLPKSQQPTYNADEEGQDDDDDYPTLFFRGTTVTYWGNEAPMPRGGVHGKVRPVYAREEDVDEIMSKGPRGKKKVEALHWSITHVYEGEDRWQLEGIQPGPPGTRAPIFGIWTDAVHEEESPNGPFVYWMMDERPWREIERLNRQEAETAAAARAAAAAANNR